mmetsp:Transcript_807/g.1559  ORF Transcript_807/g.1559 Transcript_807/m.1559 type:complete len:563 (-) Transcript_807:123-1811(-)|eukprot:CAMPEP_0175155098 /NCGR_PEP_ID=MMETSP0087-20121206/20765_1 /TAXON_ID=136419 /ORGANISM="Unknown Unknown, Strain D1" /LENGTH=562 /DNA_ID=CAMNT_0016442173 /DNA_START=20 /DNA_END=1708 /DNA_ORIENTATION=+
MGDDDEDSSGSWNWLILDDSSFCSSEVESHFSWEKVSNGSNMISSPSSRSLSSLVSSSDKTTATLYTIDSLPLAPCLIGCSATTLSELDFDDQHPALNAKQSARAKRAHRFPADLSAEPAFRYAFGSGHTVWGVNTDFRSSTTLIKKVLVPGSAHEATNEYFHGVTELERKLEIAVTGGTYYAHQGAEVSLDKNKRWQVVPAMLEQMADIKCKILSGATLHNKLSGKYYDKLAEQSVYVLSSPETFTAVSTRNNLEMNRPIKDSFYFGMLKRQNRKRIYRNLPLEARKLPEGITDRRLPISLMSARSNAKGVKVRSAKVENWSHKSFWAPATTFDKRDYLTIDLGHKRLVSAFGTKGRATQYDANYERDEKQPTWFVSSYRLFYKLEKDGHWVPLGTFAGNSDRDTEVAHRLVDESSRKAILMRYLRYQPDQFTGHKAVRVGVYGPNTLSNTHAAILAPKEPKNSVAADRSGIDLLCSDRDGSLEHKSQNSQLQPYVSNEAPAVVFIVNQYTGNRHMKKHRFRTSICSCHMCSYREDRGVKKYNKEHIRQELREYRSKRLQP